MSTRPNKSTRELSAAGTTFPGAFRVIPTHGGPHPSDLDPTWYGDSIGHWEGDTLVVDIIQAYSRSRGWGIPRDSLRPWPAWRGLGQSAELLRCFVLLVGM
jgi:hypothetical protein